MERNKHYIIRTWVLLICFVAGQYIVYAHTHAGDPGKKSAVHYNPNTQPKQTLTENCRLCDAMHHNSMAVNGQAYFSPVVITGYAYKAVNYNFVSIALILSAGRSPPMA